jgi:hypothetical protein
MSNLCKKCNTAIIDDFCDNDNCDYSHWIQEITQEDIKNLSIDELEEKYDTRMMNQCYLKDATDKTKERVQLYFKEKFGFIFKIERLEQIFSEYKTDTWHAFEQYYDIEKHGVGILDTADREWIWEHLWVRVMGYSLPDYRSQEEFNLALSKIITRMEKENWFKTLYLSTDVHKNARRRKMHVETERFDIEVEGFTLPEYVEIEGLSFINDVILEVLEENRALIKAKLELKIKEKTAIDK